jgi:hypothetical protein
VIGDYGMAGPNEQRVAALVASWRPDFVITLGDNNYPSGAFETIDDNIGQYYHQLIGGYAGRHGCASATNRFFPSLGNHDWYTAGAEPYLEFFDLPGNERYYDTVQGDVHLFALDSDPSEPDGVGPDSIQATWLHGALSASKAPWRIVYMHHPPYSAGPHGSTLYMQWPYKQWGASLVLGGHDHIYQRMQQDGMTYVVNGLGGAEPYTFATQVAGTLAQFTAGFGAMLIDADASQLRGRFHTVNGELIDQFVLSAANP